VFLGYTSGEKGWKVCDLETREIFVSRNVVFFEDKFPFHEPTSLGSETEAQPLIGLPYTIPDGSVVYTADNTHPSSSGDRLGTVSNGPSTLAHDSPLTLNMGDMNLGGELGQAKSSPFGTDGKEGELGSVIPDRESGLDVDRHELGLVDRGSELGSLPEQGTLDHKNADSQQPVRDGPASSQPSLSQAPGPSLTRNSRIRRSPAHLDDYVCYPLRAPNPLSLAHRLQDDSSGTSYPIANYVHCNNFSVSHNNFLAAISKVKEPRYYHEAARDPKWRLAMEEEIRALEKNKTWVPPGSATREKAH